MSDIDTLLFDLDGTLVDQFEPGSAWQFTWLVLRRFAGLAPPHITYRAGHRAIRALSRHQSDRTNLQALVETFAAEAGVDVARVAERVEALATTDFARMGWRFRPVTAARYTLLAAREMGYRLVVATNPTVPVPMTHHRLRWAGLGDIDWAYIAHPGDMTRTKPDVAYYKELLGRVERPPGACLMIGNDPRKDGPAMDAGIQTFILDRTLSKRGKAAIAAKPPDHFGTYAELNVLLVALAAERGAVVPASELFYPEARTPDP